MIWTIKVGNHENKDYAQFDNVKAESASDALRDTLPNFDWTMGIRLYHRPTLTICYSGPDGWAEVSKQ